MGNYSGDRRSSFGGRGSNRGGFQPRGRSSFNNDRGPREMFKAVCDNCGKDCEVPFRPTSGKPVYCSNCFEKMGGRGDNNSRGERNDRPRPEFRAPAAPTQDLSELNAKLDRIISLLEPKVQPTVAEAKAGKEVKVKRVKKVITPEK